MKYPSLVFAGGAIIAQLTAYPAYATKEVGNGGDICEDRFKIVRDDIQQWIEVGGPAGLTLPQNVLLAQYDTGMLTEIAKAQVSCTDGQVDVDGAEKTCENFTDASGTPQIKCNRALFMATAASDQYVLVHHEYAGLAGFETNDGPSSQYSISNQVSGYLTDETEKKLAIHPVNGGGGHSSNALVFKDVGAKGDYILFADGQGKATLTCNGRFGAYSTNISLYFDFYPKGQKEFSAAVHFDPISRSSEMCTNLYNYLLEATPEKPVIIIVDFQAALTDPDKLITIQ